MCVGVEFFQNDEPQRVYVTHAHARLPVRLRGGRVVMMLWGARANVPGVEDDTGPGHMKTWPEGGWAPLDDVRAGKWGRFDPKPVKIAVNRFVVIGNDHVSRWTYLRRGQYLQGLVAQAGNERRVYVVTVHPPEGVPGAVWPRVVSTLR